MKHKQLGYTSFMHRVEGLAEVKLCVFCSLENDLDAYACFSCKGYKGMELAVWCDTCEQPQPASLWEKHEGFSVGPEGGEVSSCDECLDTEYALAPKWVR